MRSALIDNDKLRFCNLCRQFVWCTVCVLSFDFVIFVDECVLNCVYIYMCRTVCVLIL